ncbi:putative ferric-chelate reductase 1 homolog [Centruroides sculpturatus]|uniref:putative ferric-chelate reductase 1 homolog n=1 Tax=Centruroides sculpturatus TaxID=218467 RepID=UPI000C6D5784|nr:putative ferric-chelate reductase 1 homolog [Centruroides sculpturatus]
MKFLLLLISYIYLTSYEVDAHGSGAPESTCKSMNPKHGATAQTIPAPYEVSVKPLNGQFEVSIKSKNFNKFRGFFLQAREKDNPDEIVDGEFTLPSNTKHVNCESSQSALTHNSNIDKNEITTVWTSRGGYKGYIIFRATVVKTAKEFWTMVDSDPVEVSDSHIPSTVTTKKPMSDKSLLTYDECGGTKGCFGMPEKCIENKNCDILFSHAYESGKDLVEFEISTKVDSISGHWIAVGLSEDQLMGSDSVGDCVVANGKPSFHYSWNEDKSNAIRNKISGIEVVSATLKDGILSCKWTREISLVENGISFDLINNKYYLLLANGPLESLSPIIKRQHDSTLYSSSKVNLTSISNITGSSSFAPLFKAHGSLMIIAWAGLVSIGILLARHYKDAWDEKTLCNVKIWFALHRAFMVTAVLMIVTAFILVFVYLKQWTNKATTHAILGCVATGFAVLQPIGALFRPGPTDSKRPIFNWLHWMGGNAGFISASKYSINFNNAGCSAQRYPILI